MNQGRESLHAWSLTMAALSLAATAVWLLAPGLLSPAGMTVAYSVWALGMFGLLFARIRGHRRWADRVTGARVLLCVLMFASFALDPQPAWWKVAVAALILVLDGVDGALARRTGPTERGAVFDMESDAFYLLTMCGIAHVYLGVTAWVFILGVMRPLYVCIWAALRLFVAPRSPNRKGSQRSRVIHLALVLSMLVALAPWFSLEVKHVVAGIAVALICYSYLADIIGTLRPPAPV